MVEETALPVKLPPRSPSRYVDRSTSPEFLEMMGPHYSPTELGLTWGIDADRITRLAFRMVGDGEAGIMVLPTSETMHGGGYTIIRISEAAVIRIYNRLTHPVGKAKPPKRA